MTKGVRFGFSGSWCSPGLETSWNGSWQISGAGGTARWDGDHLPAAELASGQVIEPVVDDVAEEIRETVPEIASVLQRWASPTSEPHPVDSPAGAYVVGTSHGLSLWAAGGSSESGRS